jgi:hypothetical protein
MSGPSSVGIIVLTKIPFWGLKFFLLHLNFGNNSHEFVTRCKIHSLFKSDLCRTTLVLFQL